jgi:hypothetical protein
MMKEELRRKLRAEGIRDDAYDVDGELVDERYVLQRQGDSWVVYYSERGLRSHETSFRSEDEACAYLYERLQRDPTTKRS